MSSPDSSQPSIPSALAPAIQLEAVTAFQVEEDVEASSAESNKESSAEAKPTSEHSIELMLNPNSWIFIDPALYLSKKLDGKTFSRGFSFIFAEWTRRPHIQVTGIGGCLFKLFLWCLR